MKPRLAFVVLGLALLPIPAFAHAHLAGSTPADGSVLTVPPTQFLLKFSEAAHLTALSLRREGGAKAQKIAPLPTAASRNFSITAPKLSAGSAASVIHDDQPQLPRRRGGRQSSFHGHDQIPAFACPLEPSA